MPGPNSCTNRILFTYIMLTICVTQTSLGASEIDLTRAVVVVPDGLSSTEDKAVQRLGRGGAQAIADLAGTRSSAGRRERCPSSRSARPACSSRSRASIAQLVPAAARRQGSRRLPHPDRRWEAMPRRSWRSSATTPAASSSASAGCCASCAWRRGTSRCRRGSNLASAPKYPLRGHQLGYRPKTNSYDAWDLAQWDRYIRELAIFGTNAIELIPPRSDDAADSPHFPLPPLEMMAGMSQICADYGLDVWIWYPAMDADYADPKTVEYALEEWAEVFKKLPRIDAVFVPGGDPGHTRPKFLMALLEKQAENLRRYHPKAQMWVSPQSFTREWFDEFLALMKAEPAWLAGVVFGPQVRVSLPELRKALPAKYPIRDYPDITHSLRCQYPVPDWDVAYALTEGREVINPRPRDEAAIFHAFADQTIGFITYSEGCNDDVNKIVWSALGWDPEADVLEVLRDYGRCLVGLHDREADDFAHGLFALEQNWRGPLLSNGSVETTLQQFRALERRALAACAGQLAVPAGPLPRLLRRLCAQPPDLRDRPRRAGAGSPARGPHDRVARGDGPGRGHPRPGRHAAGRRRSPCAGLRAGRGVVSEHSHAIERAALQGDRGRPRCHARHDRPGL